MTGAETPQVSLCLATTLDGKISDHPNSAPNFTSRYDREKLFRLRAESDALLVGANTVRQEKLPPLVRNADHRAMRQQRGMTPHPAAVIVSGSLDLPLNTAYFQEAQQELWVLTNQATESQKRTFKQAGVGLLETGKTLCFQKAIRRLGEVGYRRILAEGGGRLTHSLLAAGVVDRLYLTLAPLMMGGMDNPSLCKGPLLDPAAAFRLQRFEQVGDELHLEYHKKP